MATGRINRAGPCKRDMRRNRKRRSLTPYAYDLSGEEIKRQRQKARDLRATQWWKRQCAKGKCHYCSGSFPPGELTMDHIVPIARGGKSTKGNTVPACKACNSAKKQMLPMEWEAYLESKKKLP